MINTDIKYEARLQKVYKEMDRKGLDFLILTSLPSLAYTGNIFQNLAWYVNTCVILSRNGKSSIVIPYSDYNRISSETWIDNIQTWNPPLRNMKEKRFEEVVAEQISNENKSYNTIGVESNLTWIQNENLKVELPNSKFLECDSMIQNIMMIKEPEEIPLMRKVASLCDIGFNAAVENIKPGMTEVQLCGEIEYAMRKAGCDGYWGGGNQAGTGTAVLLDHYPTSKVIKEDHNVKFGIHPSYKLYRGDIAATVTLKKPSTKFKHLADVCTEATEACIDVIRPGIKSKDIDNVFQNIMEENGYGDYAGWHIGHGIGTGHLPPIISQADETIIEPNMVIVINTLAIKKGEPGVVYETMILVTENGYERLGKNPIHLVDLSK